MQLHSDKTSVYASFHMILLVFCLTEFNKPMWNTSVHPELCFALGEEIKETLYWSIQSSQSNERIRGVQTPIIEAKIQ